MSAKRSPSPTNTEPTKKVKGIEPSGLGLFSHLQEEKDDTRFVTPLSSPMKPPTSSTIFGSMKKETAQFADLLIDSGYKPTSGGFASLLEKESGEDTEASLETATPKLLKKEEDEILEFQGRAKLFHMNNSANWKERGIGIIKLLRNKSTLDRRLVMRTEAVLRLILNIKVTGVCEVVQDKYIRLVGTEDNNGTPISFLVKFSSAQSAMELYSAMERVKKMMKVAKSKDADESTPDKDKSVNIDNSGIKDDERAVDGTEDGKEEIV